MWTAPDELLSENRLLLDEQFDKLGGTVAEHQTCWVTKVEAALKAVQHIHDNSGTQGLNRGNPHSNSHDDRSQISSQVPISQDDPGIAIEGSIMFRRRST